MTEAWKVCCDDMQEAIDFGFVCFAEATFTEPGEAPRETHLMAFDTEKAVNTLDYCPWCSEPCFDDEAIDAATKAVPA